MLRLVIFFVVTLWASISLADTVCIESNEDIIVIRGIEQHGSTYSGTVFEIVGSKMVPVLCVAFDDAGQPVGTSFGSTKYGRASFEGLFLEQIEKVTCRYTR
ncbi:hypothetical protein [Celeribacter indicus]|uniref:Uncharacterized protein n=1 Tax=Celeribacter indicus TaxID=1208324 RepID=A0A0B5E6K8_9RHOB|nr:hypothetical protein [Celeribacter indicus]AJE47952.1 hypothetical protein P73_3237 [Celeribacter indicus]SDW27787.1 hypothetical protein SAMN05443573_102228 [Celeribacter indicus]